MAALSAAVKLTSYGVPTSIKVPAGVADTFYQGAILSWLDATTHGVTPVSAAGLRFAGICLETVTGAAIGDEIEIAIDGLWKLPVAIANGYDADGELLYVDASAGSDNPADLLCATAATTDYGCARIEKWVDASNVLANIAIRADFSVHA